MCSIWQDASVRWMVLHFYGEWTKIKKKLVFER